MAMGTTRSVAASSVLALLLAPVVAGFLACGETVPHPAYAKQPIVSVQLSVPGGATSGPVNITLVSVVENQ